MLTDIARGDVKLYKGEIYTVDKVVVDMYRIQVPMKQKGKFKNVLIKDDEGKLQ